LFGVELNTVMARKREANNRIPAMLQKCIAYLDKYGTLPPSAVAAVIIHITTTTTIVFVLVVVVIVINDRGASC
jgi:hypothetical protein